MDSNGKISKTKLLKNGISARKTHYLIAFLVLLISTLLLFATYYANQDYSEMKKQTKKYAKWEQDAYELQQASDYLTENVRCFAETGKKKYLDNYFEEANVVKRRDKALNSIKEYLDHTAAYKALKDAMNESVELMNTEYYSMRLTADAYSLDIKKLPKEIQNVKLKDKDAALSPAEKDSLARSMVFDEKYHRMKNMISDDMNECLSDLDNSMEKSQKDITQRFNKVLKIQWILIVIAICVTLILIICTLVLVVSPLLRAVVYVRADQAIPVRGSREFQFLARTYNMMYESNKEQKEKLAYDATHDKLTNIYNRSGYAFLVKNTDWETSALLLFDADKFKAVNDGEGHEMGDRVLVEIAKTIKDAFRSNDYVCRLGGDEFAVIVTNTNFAVADKIADRVRMINDALMHPKDDIPQIQISCGGAFCSSGDDYEELFRKADAALYRVKSKGGGDCELCTDQEA